MESVKASSKRKAIEKFESNQFKIKQTFSTLYSKTIEFLVHSTVHLSIVFSIILPLICMLYSSLRILLFIYILYILYDDVYEKGGYQTTWFRRSAFWKIYANYYPTKLIKTEDLDPQKNYIFGYHPHGLLALGALCQLATDGTNFSQTFPGIDLRLTLLKINLFVPFFRELILWSGGIDSSKKSIEYLLNSGPGKSVIIAVGGAKEAVLANPGKADLVLLNRFGFVKLAIRNGCDLVPVYCFGENHIVKILGTNPHSYFYRIQQLIKRIFGFYLLIYQGTSPFSENFGYNARKIPLVTVVGRPIKVKQLKYPSDQYVQQIHKQYVEALTKLYNENKLKYNPEPKFPPPELKLH